MKPNQTHLSRSSHKSFLSLSAVAVAALFFLLPSVPALAVLDGTLSLDPASQTVVVDDTGIVYTGMIDPGTNEVNVVTFSITFDPAVLQLDSITRSAAFDNTMSSDIDNVNGTGTITVFNLGANYITTPQDVADFSFTALFPATDSPIDVDSSADAAAHGEYVIFTRTGATVTVNDFFGATPPDITQDAPITSPTSDDTPDYSFTVSENVDLTYFGDCSSATATAITGSNTITFNSLADGVHSNCVIRATDVDGHWRNLNVTSFTVDTTPPTILSVSSNKANGAYTDGEVIDIDVTFSEEVTSTGDVTVTLETGTVDQTCTFQVSNATTGTCDYTVQAGDESLDLTTNDIAGTIEDQVGNAMTNFVPTTNLAANKALVIDTTAPVLSALVEVAPNPTNDSTPPYGFTSDEAGTIVYGGSCAAGTTSASVGANTASFGTLTDGTYADCTIAVDDAAGNTSNVLSLASFDVDATRPTITSVSSDLANGTYDAGQVVDIDVTFSEAVTSTGDVTVTLETGATDRTCTFTVTNDTTGTCDYTVQAGDASADLNVNTIAGTIEDQIGNAMTNFVPTTNLAANKALVIDTGAPFIAQVTAVPSPTNDTTPNYTFSSTEDGTITYGGDCASADTTASVGNNTITFNALSAGTHSNCTITVDDSLAHASNVLNVNSFTIDLTAPVVAEVTPVTTPTTDTTPSYTFSSTEAGTILYGGSCDGADTTASSGNNTISFSALAAGTYSDCTITVRDAATNSSNVLSVTSFTIDAPAAPVDEDQDDDEVDTSSKNYKLYKKYKKWRGVYNRRIYREVKKLRKDSAGEYYKLKDIYWKYKYVTPEEFAKLSQATKDQYEKYKRYHKYRLYKKYHDKVFGDD